jgi:hypothetical protein
MRTETINLYQIHELDDKAKAKALEWLREAYDYPWFDEALNSIQAFCDVFKVIIQRYEFNPCGYSYVDTDAQNHHFRGFTLKDALKLTDSSFTGYCLDYDLTQFFYDSFKVSGDAKEAFEDALKGACKAIDRDIEWGFSDEALIEWSEGNEFEFLESGKKA